MTHVLKAALFTTALLLTGGSAIAGPNEGPAPAGVIDVTPVEKAIAAVIDANADVIRGHVHTTAIHVTTGQYRVHFFRNVASCVFTGVLGTTGSFGIVSPGYLTVAGDVLDANGVYVVTYNAAGTQTDSSFHLLVSC